MERQKGYKKLSSYIKNGKLFYNIAIFNNKSLIIDNVQIMQKIISNIPFENLSKYGKELNNNFIDDRLIFAVPTTTGLLF
jgi:hypothetical protein